MNLLALIVACTSGSDSWSSARSSSPWWRSLSGWSRS